MLKDMLSIDCLIVCSIYFKYHYSQTNKQKMVMTSKEPLGTCIKSNKQQIYIYIYIYIYMNVYICIKHVTNHFANIL